MLFVHSCDCLAIVDVDELLAGVPNTPSFVVGCCAVSKTVAQNLICNPYYRSMLHDDLISNFANIQWNEHLGYNLWWIGCSCKLVRSLFILMRVNAEVKSEGLYADSGQSSFLFMQDKFAK